MSHGWQDDRERVGHGWQDDRKSGSPREELSDVGVVALGDVLVPALLHLVLLHVVHVFHLGTLKHEQSEDGLEIFYVQLNMNNLFSLDQKLFQTLKFYLAVIMHEAPLYKLACLLYLHYLYSPW